ncbi:uncharacterized protein CANTADRAFT_278682 [Suhomyces tanzawaensis NRRL Y-17324]|uniref:Uncharacterized protein n=1 Tax=Suhomyces tanzawaensis NRRL Y-17324 TaxID=984487 RepID=A0A1E4SH93_9ASCO|nr:uncharacterized protein CANTADRAFT_278682 [Suhomyces tanzawaensis NRRL Y-17324]ODV78857.1 hypothetical protein CANTADRAFT_278682 [Suhomyces tanzawaensis NRRL Y-17324]
MSLSPDSQASATFPLPKTTIIINNLKKDDFVDTNPHTSFSSHTQLTVVDQIKLTVLNLVPAGKQDNYFLSHIEYWSNLPFLNRIIIILRDEESAAELHQFLTSHSLQPSLVASFPYIKVSLQENLLSRSKSFDSLIKTPAHVNLTTQLTNFKKYHNGEYPEPEPQPFNVFEDLSKMGIDVSEYNNEEQLNELKLPNVKRTKSLTKTLFRPKPSLSLSIPDQGQERPAGRGFPESPTITLDETF